MSNKITQILLIAFVCAVTAVPLNRIKIEPCSNCPANLQASTLLLNQLPADPRERCNSLMSAKFGEYSKAIFRNAYVNGEIEKPLRGIMLCCIKEFHESTVNTFDYDCDGLLGNNFLQYMDEPNHNDPFTPAANGASAGAAAGTNNQQQFDEIEQQQISDQLVNERIQNEFTSQAIAAQQAPQGESSYSSQSAALPPRLSPAVSQQQHQFQSQSTNLGGGITHSSTQINNKASKPSIKFVPGNNGQNFDTNGVQFFDVTQFKDGKVIMNPKINEIMKSFGFDGFAPGVASVPGAIAGPGFASAGGVTAGIGGDGRPYTSVPGLRGSGSNSHGSSRNRGGFAGAFAGASSGNRGRPGQRKNNFFHDDGNTVISGFSSGGSRSSGVSLSSVNGKVSGVAYGPDGIKKFGNDLSKHDIPSNNGGFNRYQSQQLQTVNGKGMLHLNHNGNKLSYAIDGSNVRPMKHHKHHIGQQSQFEARTNFAPNYAASYADDTGHIQTHTSGRNSAAFGATYP